MPILEPAFLTATVEAILLNPDRDEGWQTVQFEQVKVTFDGFLGDSHATATRPSCSRVLKQYRRGTPIRNERQITIVSAEELAEIARVMDVAECRPEWLGANLVVSGIPAFTMVPPSSRLVSSGGVSLVVDMENAPCHQPARLMEEAFPGKGLAFPKKALGLRGVMGWVASEGVLKVGDTLDLHIPPQRIYQPGLDAMAAEKQRRKAERAAAKTATA